MHEWALAEALITTALKEAEKAGLRKVARIKVRIGELQQIDEELFKSLLIEVLQIEDPMLKGAELEFEGEEAVLKCRVCGQEWGFSESRKALSEEDAEFIHFVPEVAHVYLRCPGCKSPDFEVIKGRGIWTEWIEGE